MSSTAQYCPRPTRVFTRCIGILSFFLASASAVVAQEAVSIDQLRRGFQLHYDKEVVSVRGWVATEKRVASTTFKGFYLKDRYGSLILIRTTNPLPEITSELLVTGVATQDADSGDIYLAETKRASVGKDAEDATRREEQRKQLEAAEKRAADEAANRQRDQARYQTLLIGIAGVVVVLVILALWLMRRRRAAIDASSPSPLAQSRDIQSPRDSRVDDFKTVKVYKTTKVMPGELVVVDGGKETDVLYLSDHSGRGEIEIGRDSPEISGGIRIKDPTNTVSRRQARLLYLPDSRQFQLVNLAGDDSNPTAVNGRTMHENESATLADGDKVVMGSLTVKFRAKHGERQ